jgi:phage protein U
MQLQKMQNRCQMSPDTRPLKRSQQRRGESRQSGGTGTDKNILSTVLFPDVYPQHEKQEEDNLQPERLNRGYQIEVVHSSLVRHEYDSLIKVIKEIT